MWDLNEPEDEGIQQDFQSSTRHASVLNHQRASTASSLSGSSLIGGASPSMRKRNSSSGEGIKSSYAGSLLEINDSESASGMIVCVCVCVCEYAKF